MRVIAGQYRGRSIKSPSELRTRPTSDRLRETLFNVLAPSMNDETRFLDLCAGTGAIGIEALSRGASFVTFVDRSRRSCALIEENLDNLDVPQTSTEIFALDAENFVGRNQNLAWNIAYFDPPYDSDYSVVLHDFGTNASLLSHDGILVVEHHSKKRVADAVGDIRRWRILKQGESSLSFYERA